MDTPQTANSLTENEIIRIAYLTYLNRDAVRDEIASVDCFLRSHERCVIEPSSPIFDIARIVVTLGNKSIFVTRHGLSLSIYDLASVSSLADQYINTYSRIDLDTRSRNELDYLCNGWPLDSEFQAAMANIFSEPVDHCHPVRHTKHRFWRTFILFFRRLARRLHLYTHHRKK